MQVHPRLGRLTPHQLRRRVAGCGTQGSLARPGAAAHHAEVEQNGETVTVAAQQIRRAEVAVEQILAVQGREHGQQLAQQQQDLAGPEHQLALGPGRQELGIGAAHLPLPHQPEVIPRRDRRAEARHLGMEHPLQAHRDRPRPLLVELGAEAPQGNRRLAGQGVCALPQLPLARPGLAEPALQPVPPTHHHSHRHAAAPAPHPPMVRAPLRLDVR